MNTATAESARTGAHNSIDRRPISTDRRRGHSEDHENMIITRPAEKSGSELNAGQRFAEARIKQLTGRDSINARFMRMNHFTFTPTHTLWLLGNHRPETTAGGPAFWRRIKLIEFVNVRPDTKEGRDTTLPAQLQAEGGAILAWIVRGAVDYLRDGMREPDVVTQATAAYAAEQDTVARFLKDECTIGGGDNVRVTYAIFSTAYARWCCEVGESAVGAKEMSKQLATHKVGKYKSGSVRGYTNVSIVTSPGDRNALGWYK
jgi:putative DNA primase/helicase